MSRGVGLAMPLVMINLGGEMVYILEQRLSAQNISADKSERVLSEVIRAMFSPALMAELFRPQPVYSISATREVFDRLAHSSIMRLNASSMEKLFDLMTMGFKQQFLRASCPDDLLTCSLNHLEALRAMVPNTKAALELLDAVRSTFLAAFGALSAGELLAARQQVARFLQVSHGCPVAHTSLLFMLQPFRRPAQPAGGACFAPCLSSLQDRRVKVSLFLQNNTQNSDGTFRLDPSAVPAAQPPPGTIRYFNQSGATTREYRFINRATAAAARADAAAAARQLLTLGCNVYSVDEEKAVATGELVAATLAAQAKDGGGNGTGGGGGAKGAASGGGAKSTAMSELNLLAKLMGTAADDSEAKPFKLNLFGSDPDDVGYNSAGGGSVPTITLDLGQHKSAAGMLAEMKFDGDDLDGSVASGAAERKGASDSDDDLLDLMDSVS